MNTYQVVLSSVNNQEDTVTHLVVGDGYKEATAEAHHRSGHWYTDVQSCTLIEEGETKMTTTTTNEGTAMETNVLTNKDAKISAMVAALFNHNLEPAQALVLAAALLDNEKYMGTSKWERKMDKGIRGTIISIGDGQKDGITIEGWKEILISAELITKEGDKGQYFIDLDKPKEKYHPALATAGVVRKKGYAKTRTSKLFNDAVHALERTEFKVDAFMLKVAGLVFKDIDCDEQYVLEGCHVLMEEDNQPRVSEFFGDTRGRLYQAACHGPNGQSSDMARALMDLSDVPMDYDAEKARVILIDEIEDMYSNPDLFNPLIDDLKNKGGSKFILDCIELGDDSPVKKPWSFVKAVNILIKLDKYLAGNGKKPYIGMAFGLDAKCSGPQLGALMTCDEDIAAACGFTNEDHVADAYLRCIYDLEQAGFKGITREVMKKPYMGVFYGQAAGAFNNAKSFDLDDKNSKELLVIINNGPLSDLEENGNLFHKIVENSFGEMAALRKAVKAAHYTWGPEEGELIFHTHCATSHFMPDGFVVNMNYKIKVDVFGDVITPDEEPCDVHVHSGMVEHKFQKMSFRTKNCSLMDYARTGFVNLIQATDALLARLIITNLDQKEDAKHIIAVHDCFRVNVCDMIDGKLHRAIQGAYMDLFGDNPNGYLRKGTDITGLYFEGVNASRKKAGVIKSQFDIDGDRVLEDINGVDFKDLVSNMKNNLEGTGKTYFFDK